MIGVILLAAGIVGIVVRPTWAASTAALAMICDLVLGG
jgi:hypothetical protein